MAIRFIRERKGFSEYQIPYDKDKTSLQIGREDLSRLIILSVWDASNVADLRQMCPQEHEHKILLLHLKVFRSMVQEILRKPMRASSGCQSWLDRLENGE